MREYKELLGMVSKMESGAPKPAVNYVEMDISAGGIVASASPKNFSQLLGSIAKVDAAYVQPSRQQRKAQQQAQQAPRQQPVPSFMPEAEPAAKPATRMPGLHFPMRRKAQQPRASAPLPFQPASSSQARSLEEAASEELSKAMRGASVAPAPPPLGAYAQPAKRLVLPNLSLADQVAELDKIVENMRKGSFDADQMEVVKEEVAGLADILSSRPETTLALPSYEQDLLKIRKARLAEALSIIQVL